VWGFFYLLCGKRGDNGWRLEQIYCSGCYCGE
jgi:hypothetical protein